MQVVRINTLAELAPLAERWNALAAGAPFRLWEWNATWWRHYGALGQLYVLCVRDDAGEIVAIAPWYIARHPAKGRVVQFLASGEVCSDYQTVLCRQGSEDQAAAAIADWMTDAGHRHRNRPNDQDHGAWDLLELSGIEVADIVVQRLLAQLARRGNLVHSRPTLNCWRLEFPPTWDEYLALLSKSHRKSVRQYENRAFVSGRAVWRTVATPSELAELFELLVTLHQRRWQGLGEPGVFASARYTAFHREVSRALLAQGHLRMQWLELDGRPVAVEYNLCGGGVVYNYQGGMDPNASADNPGNVAKLASLKHALASGYRAFDCMRGNEPYKSRWRAQPRPCVDLRVVPRWLSSRLRHTAWMAGRRVKRWLAKREEGSGVRSQGSGLRIPTLRVLESRNPDS